MKTKKKKSFKGMTLIEILVAMVVLVVTASMIAVAGASVVYNMRATQSLIHKVNYEGKYVASKSRDTGDDKPMNATVKTGVIKLDPDKGSANDIDIKIYEANPDPSNDVLYKDADHAGNLKHFVFTPPAAS